jgi:hypothetical protein
VFRYVRGPESLSILCWLIDMFLDDTMSPYTPPPPQQHQAALIRIKRIATVVADEPSLLASIKRHDFRSFMTILPGVRAAMDKARGVWARVCSVRMPICSSRRRTLIGII